jgi:hypothetical protein
MTQHTCVDPAHAHVAQTLRQGCEVAAIGLERGRREPPLDREVSQEGVDGRVQVHALP